MPSLSLQTWQAERAGLLDDLERMHRTIRGTGPGVRAMTLLANQAYALMLSAQFQGFCRDLYAESVDYYVSGIARPNLQLRILDNLLFGLKLNRGNPNPANIGSDFGRLVPRFWPLVEARRPHNPARKAALDELNEWRNAIAHEDYAAAMLRGGRPSLTLAQVQDWRRACDGLARSFDEVIRNEIAVLAGVSPW